jgi:hypothetical protein
MSTEQDTLANLPLLRDLTYREWHSFINGYYCGVRWGSRQHEYSREKHYWRIGYLLGTGTRYGGLLAVYNYLKDNV